MGVPYLPLKWACSAHNVQPTLTQVGFDANGDVYVYGFCPSDGHEVGMTIPFIEWEQLAEEAIVKIAKAMTADAPEPITEEEIESFLENLDQMGDWSQEEE